jgi:hypothetical protein
MDDERNAAGMVGVRAEDGDPLACIVGKPLLLNQLLRVLTLLFFTSHRIPSLFIPLFNHNRSLPTRTGTRPWTKRKTSSSGRYVMYKGTGFPKS